MNQNDPKTKKQSGFFPAIGAFLKKVGNFLNVTREQPLVFYLKKTVSADRDSLTLYFQPRLLIILKVVLFFIAGYFFYEIHHPVGTILQNVMGFFKLDEIYKFKFPDADFFQKAASALFLLVLAYFGVWFLGRQIQGLLSGLAVDRAGKKLYYVRNSLVTVDLYMFAVPEIDMIVLRQNIAGRFLKIGSLELRKKSGERIVIASLGRAPDAIATISSIKNA
ncbi:MAG: hypothetical protein A2014_12065 [Spirochaetes bacterium GWF1_49_6]|nr:MAG: hypothetical protein A2014_12065 [Spirochaetes bacterium GWF1_49_6]